MRETIYKKDSKGKIRRVIISALGDVVTQQSGLLDGALTTHQSVTKGKNIGRSNETTPQQQAILEAKSKIERKLKEGYFKTIEEAESEKVILPMLAKTWENEKHKINWGVDKVAVQPKLDGMRCISFPGNKKISRKNTPIDTMDHIVVKQIEESIAFGDTPHIVDGELYVHGESFQTNMKYIKKYREGLSERIKYHIYDIVDEERPFHERAAIAMNIAMVSENCEWVPTIWVDSEEEVYKFHESFIEKGYEGTIIRWGDAGYKIKGRSSNLLKYKQFIDEVYECIDIEPMDKDPKQGVAVCKTKDGTIFRANFAASHEERKEYLHMKLTYIGQMAEIRFFEYTDDGIPRFPVCHGFRLDK